MFKFEQSAKFTWSGRIVSGLAVFPFIMSSAMKFMGGPQIVEGMAHTGIPQNLVLPLGVIEILCVVIYLIPKTAVVGAILLTGYIGGAILTHLRIGEAVPVQVVLGILVWLGLFLREPRLRDLIPFVKDSVK